MPERELTPKKDKRRKDFQAENAADSSLPPSEDEPEQVVSPEMEGEDLETAGEKTKRIVKPKRR